MRALRILILLAIIVLVGLAFYAKGPDGFFSKTGTDSTPAEPANALDKMQKMVEERLPQLRGNGERLLGDISNFFKDLNTQAKDVILSASPALSQAISERVFSATTPLTESEKDEIGKELKALGEELRQKGQEELARRADEIYQQFKKKLEEAGKVQP
ncbi:MAG: hypothetical protein ACE15F_00465 [bacterium]